jgi:hypothetical protein
VNPTGANTNTNNAQPAAGTIDAANTAGQVGAATAAPAGGTGNVSGDSAAAASSSSGSSSSSSSLDLRNGFSVSASGGNRNRPITTDSRVAGDLVIDPAAATTSTHRR